MYIYNMKYIYHIINIILYYYIIYYILYYYILYIYIYIIYYIISQRYIKYTLVHIGAMYQCILNVPL